MSKDKERNLGLILHDLSTYLTPGEWVVVGGLALRHYATRAGKQWSLPFNDLDLISPRESVLSPQVGANFELLHHHSAPPTFYYQLRHNNYPKVTIDIFDDHIGEDTITATILGVETRIPTVEEMYLYSMRDIFVLIDHTRGLPQKHIEKLRLLGRLANKKKAKDIWEKRHNGPLGQSELIYTYPSFDSLKTAIETTLVEKQDNIRDWIKSDPLAPCPECIPNPLLETLRQSKTSKKSVGN